MQVKYQVFISSTQKDLLDERRTVMEGVLNLGHIPVVMELFQAGDQSQWEYIKDRIRECDYYIVIVGERYGSVGPAGRSYTQMEYEFAVGIGVPVAAFLLHDDARKTWPQDKVEWSKREEVGAFRSLCETRMTKYWKTADELGAQVVTALVEMTRRSPRVGWVRADTVAPEAALLEIAKLSEERRALQEEVERYKAADGELKAPADVRHRISALLNQNAHDFVNDTGAKHLRHDVSLLELFLKTYRVFALSSNIYQISNAIKKTLGIDTRAYVAFPHIIAEFSANNLIEPAYRGDEERFNLTQYGKQFAMYAEAKSSQALAGGSC